MLDMTLTPSPQEQTVRACLDWLDAGGDGDLQFDMGDALCGTRACMGGFMALYAARNFGAAVLFPNGTPDLHAVADWLGLTSHHLTEPPLFFEWPADEDRNAALAAERLRAAFPQFAEAAS